MQTDVDLNAAVAAGIIGEDQAIALRNFQAQQVGSPPATSEKFPLFSGFADLMGGAGLILAMLGIADLFDDSPLAILWLPVPMLLFLLAQRLPFRAMPFTMAAILVGYTGFLLAAGPVALQARFSGPPSVPIALGFGLFPALAGTWLFWKCFRFPPTPAVLALLLAVGVALPFMPQFAGQQGNFLPFNIVLMLASSLVLVAAIWWDLTDVRRETDRSQIAFWLHCCAGYLITRCAFSILSGNHPFEGQYASDIALELWPIFGLVFGLFVLASLLLDRRSLLLGSVFPTIAFFKDFSSEAIGALFIGYCLLMFTWGWTSLRRRLLRMLPVRVAAQLPRTDVVERGQRPTRRHLELAPRKFRR